MSQKYENSGVLFKNDPKKKRTDKSPDYGGSCTIEGKDYQIAGWIKESQTQPGRKFIAFSFKPATASTAAPSTPNDGVEP